MKSAPQKHSGNVSPKKDQVSKSWFCVFNNPELHGFEGTPQEIVDRIIAVWVENNPTRTCAVAYCISADSLKHCHCVFEDKKAMRWSKIQKEFAQLYPGMHFEATKGNKSQAEDYINKNPPYDEKGEEVIYINRHGAIVGKQGNRTDLEQIEELINLGLTPDEIFETKFSFLRHERIVKKGYYYKRKRETPFHGKKIVYWHTGEAGSGKSYTAVKLKEQYGDDKVYVIAQYRNGWDEYNAEPYLVLDELRDKSQISYDQLLTILGEYRMGVAARYSNHLGLWKEVHITSVYPPEKVYSGMVFSPDGIDSYQQLARRIDYIVYHYKHNDEFCIFTMPMTDYIDYNTLKMLALKDEFIDVSDDKMVQCVFEEMK